MEIPFMLPHISKPWWLKEQLRLEVTYSWKDKKYVFYTIASRCTVHVIKAPTNYSDVIRAAEACCVVFVVAVFVCFKGL
jgi:hypothetical protein